MREREPHRSHPAAIIGMACVFPGAPDLASYWQNIVDKVSAIGDPPPEWESELFYDPNASSNDRTYCKRGGYLGPLARFDPLRFGVMPTSVDGEPDQFLALRVACDALADAGYLDRKMDRDRIEVVLGRGTYINRGFTTVVQHGLVVDQVVRILKQLHPEHSDAELQSIRQELKESLPPFNAEIAPALVPNLVTGRIANRLDLMGPNYTIDAACASSHIAVDRAMQDLACGACDLAIAGGVHVSTPAPILMIFSQLGALSRKGELRAFDEGADGTLLGEGLGIVVLKRLEDAERDGDRIYAVIRGVGVASDGRATGLLAPRVEGEELALRRAYAQSGVDPATIELIEAHGTGTQIGDSVEIEALRRVFSDTGRPGPRCALGTVKTMISHLIPAAGIAGMIKTALALYYKVLPPTLNCEKPNPKLQLERTPFYMNTETRPWIHGGAEPRRAGVNAFGFGGINAHAVLEEHSSEAQTSLQRRWDCEVVVLGAESRAGLAAECARLDAMLESAASARLLDVAWTCYRRLRQHPWRLAIVATDIEDLRKKVAYAKGKIADSTCLRIRDPKGIYFFAEPVSAAAKTAFLFPGEGSQYANMLADLCILFPEVRAAFDTIDRTFAENGGRMLPSQAIFPPPGAGAGDGLWRMDVGPEAVFTANQAMFQLLSRLGVRPDMVVGHSTGEYSALMAAGVTVAADDAELARNIRRLNALYEQAASEGQIPEGDLLTVGGIDTAELAALTGEIGAFEIAMENCPHQVIVCGQNGSVERLESALRARGALCARLPFRRAYHTPMFRPFAERVRALYSDFRIESPAIEIWSCAVAQRYPADPDLIRQLAADSWALPVRFDATVRAMHQAGAHIFIECGPRNNLSGFVDDILRGLPHLTLPSNVANRSGIVQLSHLLAQLAAHGRTPQLELLYERRRPQETTGASGKADGQRSSEIKLPTGLQPLRLRPERRAARPTPIAVAAEPPKRPGVMDQYMATMQEFLSLQNEMMTSYLAPRAKPQPHTPAASPLGYPLLGEIVSRRAGRELSAVRVFDVEADPFLHDHTFGGRCSDRDSKLRGLAAVPLTFSIEMMAEAALALIPGHIVAGVRDLRGYRWITLDSGSVGLKVTASVSGELPGLVHTVILDADDESAPPYAEADIVLGSTYSAGPEPMRVELQGERPSRWRPERIYTEIMFHGPCLQAVASMDRWGVNGSRATLRALPASACLRAGSPPAFCMAPILLDAAGQVVGLWIAEHLEHAFHVFPFRCKAIQFYGPEPPVGAAVQCVVRTELAEPLQVQSDIDLVDSSGRLFVRLTAWEDRRFHLPERFYRLRTSPKHGMLSRPLKIPASDAGVQGAIIDDLPPKLLQAHDAIWQKVLSHLVLSRKEREQFRDLPWPESRRTDWLLGRCAAKDAVRRLHRREAFPADIEIESEDSGAPKIRLVSGETPVISIAHSAGIAVAIAGHAEGYRALGCDIERLSTSLGAFADAAFDEQELALVSGLPVEIQREWLVRFWCAKESAIKLTRKPGPGSLSYKVAAVDFANGQIEVIDPAGDTVTVSTWREGEVVMAITLEERKAAYAAGKSGL
jgi:acyl transferase domain-containing protein/phosphopantetheinyl transferase